ncbi:MAG: twin-arginine translocase TatA/TatE family subunit [Acidobacteria bacterium]|nr:twin-arginine translocase TatA/TatE family subunit [Acidobacteriota bacterium]
MINQFTPAVGIGGLGGPELIVILLIVFLLFGASRLPQLAKALGQSKRAFREGIDEAEAERKQLNRDGTAAPSQLSGVDDEALFEEARRRAAQQKASEKS